MEQVNIIGMDLANRSFQLHGARSDGSVAFRRKLSRELTDFLASQPRYVMAMEACASAQDARAEVEPRLRSRTYRREDCRKLG